jgi:hypothetical protein
MITHTMLREAYALNNEGAKLGGCGQTPAALEKFFAGMQALNLRQPNHEVQTSIGFSLAAVPIATHNCDTNNFVYSNMFALAGNLQPGGDARDIALCTAVLKYNAALSLQLQNETGHRKVALRYYGQCLVVVGPLSTMLGSISVATGLYIACLHNMAEILMDREDFAKATALSKLVAQLLSSEVDNGRLFFNEEEALLFASSSIFVPYCASLSRGAAAA